MEHGEPLRIGEVLAASEWVTTSNIIYDREELIYNSKYFIIDNDLSMCGYLFNTRNMIPENRIGSESSEGEVYKISYIIPRGDLKDYEIMGAFKILPILSEDHYKKNLIEIEVANLASDLVKTGKSRYFPLVYASGSCGNVTYHRESKFTLPSKEYACINKLYKTFPNKKKVIDVLERQKTPIPKILNVIGTDENLCDNISVPADFMFSELAGEDLTSWVRKRHAIETWRNVLTSIVEGIYDLHSMLGYCHNDLHLGNVLIACDLTFSRNHNSDKRRKSSYLEYSEIPLIHDFGKSVALDEQNRWEDIRHFFLSLSKFAHELKNDYLLDICNRVLNKYVFLVENKVFEINYQDYHDIIDIVHSV